MLLVSCSQLLVLRRFHQVFRILFSESAKMTNHRFIVATFLAVLVVSASMGLPTPDEERYFDKEYNRELLNWLTSVQYPQALSNPCKYYGVNSYTGPMPKRNSELINSLLSLPKNMNDAGK